jgi:hypothetical protein
VALKEENLAMKGLLPTILLAAVAAAPTIAQNGTHRESDEQGIVRAAMDYMEGAVTADADRVARGVHEELNKVVVTTLRQTGRQVLSYNTHTTLVEIVRGLAEQMAEVDRSVEVTVFDVGNDIASARAVGQLWYDHLQLAKIKGEWRIVNVLWARNQPNAESELDQDVLEADRVDVETAALDYIEGAYSGNAERMERALHPELNKVLLNRHRQTGEQFLYKMGASNLIEGTRAGLGKLDEDKRDVELETYDISKGIAAVKVSSALYIDHLQLAKVNGEWKIINVLWVPNPEAPRPGG